MPSDPTLTGTSAAQRAFVEQLELAAKSPATILLIGESGTGKSRAARWVHAASPRADGPFRELHLGALSPTLIESELFGHERGAFTDAKSDRLGAFRQADGGSLVLDDVALLPGMSQVKLLRVLQERVVEPLGSDQNVPVDVRIVATAHPDLERRVHAGDFRQDLYFRLAVVTLELPPLRARSEDIEPLAETLLARAAERLARPQVRSLSAQALERLREHPWPGNVRELENAAERVTAMGVPGTPVSAEELDFLDENLAGLPEELARTALANGIDLERFERAMLTTALAEERGNVSGAARRVGLTRRAFEYRIERYAEPEAANGVDGEEPQ